MDKSRTSESCESQLLDSESGGFDRDRTVAPDTMLSIVANEQRRAVLTALNTALNKQLAHNVLVERVADQLLEDDSEQLSSDRRHRIRVRLHHTHLPKLEDAGLIDYETETDHIQFTGSDLEQELLALIEAYDSHT